MIGLGAVYEGDWFGRKPHGQGKMMYPDGCIYTGEWVSGLRHGHGRYVFTGDAPVVRECEYVC